MAFLKLKKYNFSKILLLLLMVILFYVFYTNLKLLEGNSDKAKKALKESDAEGKTEDAANEGYAEMEEYL